MKRTPLMGAVAVAALASLTLSCRALFPGISLPGVGYVSMPAGPDVGDFANALVEAETRCGQLAQEEVTVAEETNLGGAVALNWASRGGGLFLDDVSGQKPTAAELATPKNALNLYVATVGKNLAMQSPRPGLDWAFGVIDSKNFNAYSAPGGYVMVTRGLLQKVENEAQLAGVLAHEIAHISQKHGLKAYQKVRSDQCRTSVAGARLAQALGPETKLFLNATKAAGLDLEKNVELLGKMTEGFVQQMLNHGFDEAQEFEADAVAAELVARAGYNPYEYVAFLNQIPEGPEHFGKHPRKAARAEKLRTMLQELEKDELLAANGRKLNEYPKVDVGTKLAAAR